MIGCALLLWLAGCRQPMGDTPTAIRLDRTPEALVSVTLPERSRPEPVPLRTALAGPFTTRPGPGGVTVWQTPLPFPLALLGLPGGTGTPRGLKVSGPRGGLHASRKPVPDTWMVEGGSLVLRLPAGLDPNTSPFTVRHDPSRLAEAARSRAEADRPDAAFVLRTARSGAETHHGVFLPAPARAEWSLDVPEGAQLELTAEILPTFIEDGAASDGARLTISADGAVLETVSITPDAPAPVSVPLSAGPTTLTLQTEPGSSALLDYVFLRHPTVQVPGRRPRRLLVVFVDTLRADHLSGAGYARETTPVLDGVAASGVSFRAARSVAPWTLPSTQAALSGRQPEQWAAGPSLAEQLSADGWRTVGLVANAYLSARTGISRGFDRYRLDQLASASQQVAAATAELAAHPHQDLALMVHFMDPHLPYTEPEAFRGLWEGAQPPGLPPVFTRPQLRPVAPDRPGFEAARDYVVARYDQNIRSVDAALAPLLEAMGPDAIVVVFSDHGEEFWEHGGVEHGHSLHDELLRVPLLLRAPGLPAGAAVDTPVSLLDLTPTLLDLVGLPVPDGAGTSLLPVIRQEPGAAAVLAARPQALGRLLYGRDQWGALDGDTKHIREAGVVSVYDLAADPAERQPRPGALAPLRSLLQEAGVPAVDVWRLGNRARTRGAARRETLTAQIPGGFAAAWGPYDPNAQLQAPVRNADGSVTIAAGVGMRPTEVYLLPERDTAEGFTVTEDGRPIAGGPAGAGALWAADRLTLVEDIAVPPSDGGQAGGDPVLEAALRELGYLAP